MALPFTILEERGRKIGTGTWRFAHTGEFCYTLLALGRKQVKSLREPVAVGRIEYASG
jgi:hypothetical protein